MAPGRSCGARQVLAAPDEHQGRCGGEGTTADHGSLGRALCQAHPGAAFVHREVSQGLRASRAPAEP